MGNKKCAYKCGGIGKRDYFVPDSKLCGECHRGLYMNKIDHLITALKIFKKYDDRLGIQTTLYDIIVIDIDYHKVSKMDRLRLAVLGFSLYEGDGESFASSRY